MPRTRELKPAFFQDEDLATLSRDHRLLFSALWTLADREGRLEDRPAWIKLYSFPFDADISVDDISRMLTDLAACSGRFIVRYQANGKRYLLVQNFKKHQHIHPKEAPSVFPPVPEISETARELPGITGKAKSDPVILPLPSEPSSDPDLTTPSASTVSVSSQLPLLASGSGSEQPACQPESKDAEKIRAVFDHYRSHHPRSFPVPLPASKEWGLIRARLREGNSVENLCRAIDGYHMDPYHCGENASGTKFQSLELIMRNGSKVNAGLVFYEAKPGPVMSEREMRSKRAGAGFLATLDALGMGDKANGQG